MICAGQRTKADVLTETIEEYKEMYMKTKQQMNTLIDSVREYIEGNGAAPAAAQGAGGRGGGGGGGGGYQGHDDDDEDSDGNNGGGGGRNARGGRGGRGRGGRGGNTVSAQARQAAPRPAPVVAPRGAPANRGGRGGGAGPSTSSRPYPKDDDNDENNNGYGGQGKAISVHTACTSELLSLRLCILFQAQCADVSSLLSNEQSSKKVQIQDASSGRAPNLEKRAADSSNGRTTVTIIILLEGIIVQYRRREPLLTSYVLSSEHKVLV